MGIIRLIIQILVLSFNWSIVLKWIICYKCYIYRVLWTYKLLLFFMYTTIRVYLALTLTPLLLWKKNIPWKFDLKIGPPVIIISCNIVMYFRHLPQATSYIFSLKSEGKRPTAPYSILMYLISIGRTFNWLK